MPRIYTSCDAGCNDTDVGDVGVAELEEPVDEPRTTIGM